MRITATSVATTLILAASTVGLSVTGGQDITGAKVQQSLQASFARLYARQQTELGHPITPSSVHPAATCDRGGPEVPDVGAGSDWICMMTWTGMIDSSKPGKFELNVHSNSCYTASGPGSLIGSFTITTPAGKDLTNPVYAFDVCVDPDATTGT